MTKRAKKILYTLSPGILIILLLVMLEAIVAIFQIDSYVLPSPIASFITVGKCFGEMLPHIIQTAAEIIIGYIIGVSIGITLALIFTANKLLDKAISPYVIMLIATPQIIMVPLLMVWIGFGIKVYIIAVALSCFPVNMMNTSVGVRNVDVSKYELMKSLRASKLQTFFKVLIPSALPSVFTGMKIGCIFATAGAVGSEFVAATTGVGSQILYNTDWMKMELAFGYIYVLAIIGILIYSFVCLLEKKVCKWQN